MKTGSNIINTPNTLVTHHDAMVLTVGGFSHWYLSCLITDSMISWYVNAKTSM